MRRTARTVPLDRLVLVLACVPIVLGPPLFALFLMGREAIRAPDFRFTDWLTPALIAVVNIVLSVLVLRHLGGELIILLKEIGLWVQQGEPAAPQPGALHAI